MKKFGIVCLLFSVLLCGCHSEKTEEKNIVENTPEVQTTIIPENIEKNTIAPTQKSNSDEPVWIEDELYELAVNTLGKDKVENVAADAFTVKYLIDEPDEDAAWLYQYALLYRMKDEYKLNVKFVFYKEKGKASSAYLRTSYSSDTLSSIDLDSINDYHEIQKYTD